MTARDLYNYWEDWEPLQAAEIGTARRSGDAVTLAAAPAAAGAGGGAGAAAAAPEPPRPRPLRAGAAGGGRRGRLRRAGRPARRPGRAAAHRPAGRARRPAASRRPARPCGARCSTSWASRRVVDGLTARHMLLPPGAAGPPRHAAWGWAACTWRWPSGCGMPAWGVLVPGPLLRAGARDRGGRCATSSCCAAGEAMPESWYRSKYGVPHARLRRLPAPADRRPRCWPWSRFNLGNHHREAGALPQAAAAYRRAGRRLPRLPRGPRQPGPGPAPAGPPARGAPGLPGRPALYPTLPGLDRNLAVLDKDIDGGK